MKCARPLSMQVEAFRLQATSSRYIKSWNDFIVKRILTAFVIAVGIHGFILSLEFDQTKMDHLGKLRAKPVTMTLAWHQPAETPISQPSAEPLARPIEKIPQPPIKARPPAAERTDHQPEKVPPKPFQPTHQTQPAPSPQPPEMHPSDQVETHSSDASQAGIEAATLEQETVSPQEDASVKVGSGPLPAAPRGTPELAVHKARPLYLQNPSPPYPRLARRRGYEGSVVLDVLVLSDGTVGDLRVATSSGHKILDRAAVAAVRSWLFEAGKKGDQKVDTWVRVPIRFELDR